MAEAFITRRGGQGWTYDGEFNVSELEHEVYFADQQYASTITLPCLIGKRDFLLMFCPNNKFIGVQKTIIAIHYIDGHFFVTQANHTGSGQNVLYNCLEGTESSFDSTTGKVHPDAAVSFFGIGRYLCWSR